MKVLLIEDVKKVGKKGQVVDVADGYAQNFLIKNKLAVVASKTSLQIRETEIQDAKLLEQQNIERARQVKVLIENHTLNFKLKAGIDGKVFGMISTKQIAEQLKNDLKIDVDKRKIIGDSVNNFGTTVVKVELHKTVIADLKVNLQPS